MHVHFHLHYAVHIASAELISKIVTFVRPVFKLDTLYFNTLDLVQDK